MAGSGECDYIHRIGGSPHLSVEVSQDLIEKAVSLIGKSHNFNVYERYSQIADIMSVNRFAK